MTPRRLDWTLRARGTEVAYWPARERLAAIALLRTDPAARAMLADALARDDAAPGAPECAVLARMQGAVRLGLLQLPPFSFRVRWGVLAGCALAGLYLGLAGELTGLGDAADGGDAFAAVQLATVASNP